MTRKMDWPGLLLRLLVAAACFFVILPIAVPIAVSFSAGEFLTFPPQGFSFRWYARALENEEFLVSLWLSIELAFVAAAGALALGVPAAWALVRGRFPGRALLQNLLLTPLIFPMLVTGIALLQFFTVIGFRNGFVNLAIAHVLITLPYVVRTVSASLVMLDARLEEAARILGARDDEVFRRITLPLIARGMAAGAIFAFVTSFDNFPVSMWLKNAEFTPLPLQVFSFIDRFLDPTIAAISGLMILLSVVFILAIERFLGLNRAVP
ncbi:MAG: ABC transporter permease [Rhodospirillaceae bacterium]|nr:ABC transporter permease [Rhodospirillaceae bacterium]